MRINPNPIANHSNQSAPTAELLADDLSNQNPNSYQDTSGNKLTFTESRGNLGLFGHSPAKTKEAENKDEKSTVTVDDGVDEFLAGLTDEEGGKHPMNIHNGILFVVHVHGGEKEPHLLKDFNKIPNVNVSVKEDSLVLTWKTPDGGMGSYSYSKQDLINLAKNAH